MGDVWKQADLALRERHVPFSVVLELTRRCNLSCGHCYNVKDKSELSFEQIEGIVLQLREAGCLFLTLTGGEPLVRDDFTDILTLVRRLGFDVKLVTNGTLMTEETADAIAAGAPSEVGISLLGATAETHDGLTGTAGSFEKSLAGIRALRKRNVPVHIKCTLQKENFEERAAIRELADELGVLCLMDPVVSPRDDGSKDVLERRLSGDQLDAVYGEYFEEVEPPGDEYEPLFCEAGGTFAAVSASGDVYPCIQLPVKVGNMLETPFADIWREAELLVKMRAAEKKDLQGCSTCGHAAECYRCPGLAYLEEGDVFGPSPTACYIAESRERYERARS